MEMQSAQTETLPRQPRLWLGGAIAIMQGVIYSGGHECWWLLCWIEKRQLCVCALMIGRPELEEHKGVRQVMEAR